MIMMDEVKKEHTADIDDLVNEFGEWQTVSTNYNQFKFRKWHLSVIRVSVNVVGHII